MRKLDTRVLRVVLARVSHSPFETKCAFWKRRTASYRVHAHATHARSTTIRTPNGLQPAALKHNTPTLTVRTATRHASARAPARGLLVDTSPHRPAPLLSSSKRPPARRSHTHTSQVNALLLLELHTLQSPPQAPSCVADQRVTAVLLPTSARLRSRSRSYIPRCSRHGARAQPTRQAIDTCAASGASAHT
ncbi:hypothetical protein B0H19DRAFT_530888 [Mycena capillaripes]|nr:hypothetical protein B0H19DRAFT_530888 [Mycena capillaripes]